MCVCEREKERERERENINSDIFINVVTKHNEELKQTKGRDLVLEMNIHLKKIRERERECACLNFECV